MKDVSWLSVGGSIVVGPGERAVYEEAFEQAGFKMAEPTPAPEFGNDAVRLTRIQ